MANNYFNKFVNKGVPFMTGRTKGDIVSLIDEVLHIEDFGFIGRGDSAYSVIAFKEHPGFFFFGGTVLNDILKQVDEDGMRAELEEQPIRLKMVKSKSGRNYMGVDFVEA